MNAETGARRAADREKQLWPVAKVDEVAPGERKLVEVKKHSIGLFNVNGTYVAALNMCPHELAPVCRGRIGGTTLPSEPGEYRWGRQGEILRCPWHGREFDLTGGGRMLADQRVRLRLYPVVVEGDTVYIQL